MDPSGDSHSLNARLLRFRSDAEQEDALALAEDLLAAARYGDARGVVVSAQTDEAELDGRLLVLEARAWLLDRDLVRAQAVLVKAARLHPQSVEPYRWLAEVLLQRGDPPRAIKAIERATALAPSNAELQRLHQRAREQLAALAVAKPAVSAAIPSPRPRPLPEPLREPEPPVELPFVDLSEGDLDQPHVASQPGLRSSPSAAAAPRASSLQSTFRWQRPVEEAVASVRRHERAVPEEVHVPTAPGLGEASFEVQAATTPGVGESPAARDATPGKLWDSHSVAVPWPTLDPLSDVTPTDPVMAVPDLVTGDSRGRAEDPDAMLKALQKQGIFEEPDTANSTWPAPSEVATSAPSMQRTVKGAWLGTLLLFAAGYIGWEQWVAHRHAQAAELVTRAQAAAFDGDSKQLVDAERFLRIARDRHPRSAGVPRVEILLHAERVLESGNRELSALRSALTRAAALHADKAYLAAGRAVLAAYSGDVSTPKLVAEAQAQAKGEPSLLYVVGRLKHRLGQEDADALLGAAVAAAPDLVAAALARAEAEHDQGHAQEALASVEAVLKQKPKHLRANLWKTFLTADAEAPERSLVRLQALAKDVRVAAPVDRILWGLSRARLLRRKGEREQASSAVREALLAGTSEPRLLALVASEARRQAELGLAQQAAMQAVAAAPRTRAYRVLLAGILTERGDGDRALSLLAELPKDDASLVLLRARASLASGDRQAQRAALDAITSSTSGGAAGVELVALRLRLQGALEPSARALQEARNLLRRAPGDPEALRAVAEVALALREPKHALTALESLTKLAPEDGEAQHLLGRALRMAVDAPGAEAALRRALLFSPGDLDVLATLAGLHLDTGKYAQADELYEQLATGNQLAGRLGRAEALLGLGRIDDAHAQITGLSENQRAGAAAREVGAKVALARAQPGEALSLLRPLIEAEQKRAIAWAIYGDALHAAEQIDSAGGAYESALELDADLPEALLGRAEIHLRADRAKDALQVLERAESALLARLRPPAVRARMLTAKGRAYVQRDKRGDLETARDLLREAVQRTGVPPEAHFWLGEALGGRRTPEAAAAFKRYLELAPEGAYAARAKRALGPLL